MTINKSGQSKATNLRQRGLRFLQFSLLLSGLLLLLIGCDQLPQSDGNSNNNLVNATWDQETSTLSVSGVTTASQDNVQIHDAADPGILLGQATVNSDGSWSASSTVAACEVHVELPSGTETVAVNNAPADCTGSGIAGRVATVNDIPANVLVVSNPEPLNAIPNAVILSPAQNLTINAGETVFFMGTAVGTNVAPPIYYYWNFGGATSNSSIQNPGPIRFDIPGVYFVQLSVSDNLGIPDPTPAVRTIVVNGSNVPATTSPVPSITSSPSAVNGSISVNVGQSVFFSGSATDNTGSNSFTYEWNFSGIFPTQFGPTPGLVPFNRAGTYVVSLYATSAQGVRSAIPATVTVSVGLSPNATNQAPVGTIIKPASDVVINVGETLKFKSTARDPDNNYPLTYSWDFNNVAPAIIGSTSAVGGNVTFNTPGTFYIRLTVTDSLGMSDPNPPIRVVTVQSPAQVPPGNGTLSTQIISPATDMTIVPGQSVYFSGLAVGGNNTTPYLYFWNFDGGATNSSLQTPGNVTFAVPGQYTVVFYATDFIGNVVGTPVMRTITVADPSSVNGNIVSPLDNSTIMAGTPVNLIGNVSNSTGFFNLSYEWIIKDRAGRNNIYTSTQLSPPPYVFAAAGSYVVKFKVTGTDIAGNQTVASNSKVSVTVTSNTSVPPGSPNPTPIINGAGISSPATDMVIYIGTNVNFEAVNFGFGAVYNWDFGGARTPSNSRTPGLFQFNVPGTYYVTLQVSGSSNGVPINGFDQKVITVLQQQNPTFPPPTQNPSSAGIQSPATDMVISPGTSVAFRANNFGNGAVYNWNFGNAAAPSSQRDPSAVTFFNSGTYLVTLRVTGTSNGIPISLFDQRAITVLQGSSLPPIGTSSDAIASPATDMTINVGTRVDFRANDYGIGASYRWDFSGAASPSTRSNPRDVTFSSPGTFRVTLMVTGTSNGIPINVFAQRTITVLQSGFPPINPPVTGASGPEGYITQPSTAFVRLSVGQSQVFSGAGFDPIGSGPLNFQWSFGGANRNIDSQNPGSVTFSRVGTYVVTLLVKNAFGQFDMTPAYVVVDVVP